MSISLLAWGSTSFYSNWTHFSIAYNGDTKTLRLFANGALVGTRAVTGSWTMSSAGSYIRLRQTKSFDELALEIGQPVVAPFTPPTVAIGSVTPSPKLVPIGYTMDDITTMKTITDRLVLDGDDLLLINAAGTSTGTVTVVWP